MEKTNILRTFSLLGLATCLAAISFAQTASSRLLGVVSDPSGAHVAGASVTVTNQKTGVVRNASTNADGLYVVQQLEPSTFSILVTHAGFSDAQVGGVALGVGQEITQNVALQVGELATSVSVDETLAHVDTSSARVGVNISEREVAQLPLNGRQISQLY